MLNGKHANTTVPKLTGAVKRYTVLTENEEYYNALSQGEKDSLNMYLEAAKNFWDITIDHHTYVTGGNSLSISTRQTRSVTMQPRVNMMQVPHARPVIPTIC